MYMAISMNRADFVKEFLDRGFILSKFLTYRCLLKLYNDVNIQKNRSKNQFKINLKLLKRLKSPKNSPLFNYLRINRRRDFKQDDSKSLIRFRDIGFVIQHALRNFYVHEFCQKPYKSVSFIDVDDILRQTVRKIEIKT